MSTELPAELSRWLERAFPEYPHAYWGQSGASLLFDGLQQEGRKRLILPAFICSNLPAMALAAGMEVVLVDVNPETLLMRREAVEQCLAEGADAETALLVDHCFGYPFLGISELRRNHPRLLVIEDCARALGGEINGKPVGHAGDWVLLSLYKTTPGNNHGAVLLTRSAYSVRSGPPPKVTWRQWASTSRLLRVVYEFARRRRPEVHTTRRESRPLMGVSPRRTS
jgi:dTDP-4-amino-4,6-dideoxygalactose transaminase